MYKVPVEVRKSAIDGLGVFAKSNIKKNSVVWQFTYGYDKKISKDEFNGMDASRQDALQRIAYLSPYSDMWVLPPENDPACYTNHDATNHNISAVLDKEVSDEPIFVANRDIEEGEEITNSYLEFDDNSHSEKFEWLKS